MGVVCIGVVPMGVVSIGVVAMGVINLSIVGMGLLAVGVNTMGVWTAGPMNMGLVRLGGSSQGHDHSSHHGSERAEDPRFMAYPSRAEAEAQAKLIGCEGCIRWAATGWPVQSIQRIITRTSAAIWTDSTHIQARINQFEIKFATGVPTGLKHCFAFELFGSTAADTDQVVVMDMLRVGQFKSTASLAQLQFLQEIHFHQQPQRSIDGGQRHLGLLIHQLAVDLFCTEMTAAADLLEQIQNKPTLRSHASPVLVQTLFQGSIRFSW